jgi:hypothetical protein
MSTYVYISRRATDFEIDVESSCVRRAETFPARPDGIVRGVAGNRTGDRDVCDWILFGRFHSLVNSHSMIVPRLPIRWLRGLATWHLAMALSASGAVLGLLSIGLLTPALMVFVLLLGAASVIAHFVYLVRFVDALRRNGFIWLVPGIVFFPIASFAALMLLHPAEHESTATPA